ncbi:unknown [Pasteurella multocida subsp. multocida str. Pm70]|nr:RecName: Full=Uncharacterized protein PM1932 [Pasteurella multocida subsp. multocida str. Pm70]AAK04016.1 unknown [Pasteurella multocida subsp. multocida str. Pm70]
MKINKINGTPYWIRTNDLRLRRPLLYPAELRAHFKWIRGIKEVVGEIGFEPTTHWSQTSCATKLRYSPTNV